MSGHENLTKLVSLKLPFAIDWLPKGTCLVGGAVRDALLNRQRDHVDLDLVLPSFAVETAQKVANHHQAGFVILDRVRQIARVVFEQGTVDFALQEGENLTDDLRRRDFTVNAIAYDLSQSLIFDPLEGQADLARQSLRMIAVQNLANDPLRLLRAYRQAAQLNFSLEPETQSALRQLAPLIGQMAAERVQTEINYLLSHRRGLCWLKTAWQDGVISPWLGAITAQTWPFASAIDPLALDLEKQINYTFSSHCLRLGKLACLVNLNPDLAELELLKLKYSRSEIRTVLTVLRALPLLKPDSKALSLKEQYELFLVLGKIFPVFALIALAMNYDHVVLLTLFQQFLDSTNPVAHPQPLVTGKDLITQLGLSPSPLIGQLLTKLQIAQIEGKIQTVENAIAFAHELIKRPLK